ncbi:hypothetical protein GGR56DRAFT_288874, partial [Xylariaceae sp. FL0804]
QQHQPAPYFTSSHSFSIRFRSQTAAVALVRSYSSSSSHSHTTNQKVTSSTTILKMQLSCATALALLAVATSALPMGTPPGLPLPSIPDPSSTSSPPSLLPRQLSGSLVDDYAHPFSEARKPLKDALGRLSKLMPTSKGSTSSTSSSSGEGSVPADKGGVEDKNEKRGIPSLEGPLTSVLSAAGQGMPSTINGLASSLTGAKRTKKSNGTSDSSNSATSPLGQLGGLEGILKELGISGLTR